MHSDEFLVATLGAADLVYNLARRLVRDEDSARDLVQETYLRAFESWQRHRRPESPGPWLATICLNAARSQHRRARARPQELLEAEAGADVSSPTDTAAQALAALDRAAVHRGLWELPEEQRIAVTLMDLCGLSASEIARATGSPRGTVLSRVHRGRKALAARLGKEVRVREP
jgi:RNA polymerase sigma-70 factor (ECF subfamily)